jgi:hypothetical protein
MSIKAAHRFTMSPVALCRVICAILLFSIVSAATAQLQQAWVERYNNGLPGGTNQASKMALDSVGNIYVVGISQNTNGNLGCATLKYAANGLSLWVARLDSNNLSAAPALAVDRSNNVAVVGNGLTAKYDTAGDQLWTAPYAGTAVATDTNGNVYVTGYDTNFSLAELNATGSNIWPIHWTNYGFGPAISQAIGVDLAGNVWVGGSSQNVGVFDAHPVDYQLLQWPYGSENAGDVIGYNSVQEYCTNVSLATLAFDNASNVYSLFHYFRETSYNSDNVAKGGIGSTGQSWSAQFIADCNQTILNALAVDQNGNVFVSGQDCFSLPNGGGETLTCVTYKADSNGKWLWTNYFPGSSSQPAGANAIAVDLAGNGYITGYSPGANRQSNIVTIKYGPNGNQLWMRRYAPTNGGSAVGNAVAVDASGDVYVAGHEETASGGTEMVLIKYAPVGLQRLANGTVLLQAEGEAGESFLIQTSTNLQTWLNLGTISADTNGLVQFTDTNAPHFDWRYYLAIPQ